MSFYILAIESLNNTFSFIEAGKSIKYKYGLNNSNDINIIKEDLVLGYYKKSKSVKYLFKVMDTNSDSIVLKKLIDVDKGYIIKEELKLIEKIEFEELIEIEQEQFNNLYKNLLNSIPDFKGGDESEVQLSNNIQYQTGFASKYPRNLIYFGAPGTGKSFTLEEEKDKLLEKGGYSERVTFHQDYSYANFVGTYKPVPDKDNEGNDTISYKFVPGPFMRLLVKALQNSKQDSVKPFLLIIEEINRANSSAVFGDVFQLLDRDKFGVSQYSINTSEDMKEYLANELGGYKDEYEKIKIPNNMFIWATMNSADQGVFFIDTAFKRRWDFVYLNINNNQDEIPDKKFVVGKGNYKKHLEWNEIRKAINKGLLSFKINEDKLLGPFFIKIEKDMSNEVFNELFKNKIIMYLFEDVARSKRNKLFKGCESSAEFLTFSEICDEYDEKGIEIFCNIIKNEIKYSDENRNNGE